MVDAIRERDAKAPRNRTLFSCNSLSRKSFAAWKELFSGFSWERTLPACTVSHTLGTLEACAPRDDLRVLRVSAVRLFGCGWAAVCNSWPRFFGLTQPACVVTEERTSSNFRENVLSQLRVFELPNATVRSSRAPPRAVLYGCRDTAPFPNPWSASTSFSLSSRLNTARS